jgi:uncharacterized protein (TIGR02466 family)
MNIHNLFPTPVGFFDFPEPLTDDQLQFIKTQQKKPNEGNTTSANRKILECEILRNLNAHIKSCVDVYFQEVYKPKFDVKLRITQSWLNYSEPGQFHHKHAHPNSLVSGCFYVNADENADKIFFFKEEYEPISIERAEFNLYNSKSWWLPVKTNQIILFPSSLTHMVRPVEAKETRISVAFNAFPVGYIGNDDTLTGLHL